MNIVAEKPPEWIMDGCLSQFRVDVNNTYWTYGDTIFNPGGKEIPGPILSHEAFHMVQQREYDGGKDAWWKEYLINPDFRYEQELQAHAIEYAAVCDEVKDRNRRATHLRYISSRLAGPLYQAPVSQAEAMNAIRAIAKAL